MPYLDDNKEFWDYNTGTISGNDVIDTTTTGVSFYDNFLTSSGREYVKNKHNLKGEIVYMTPDEYYKCCGEYGFPNSPLSPDKLKKERSWDKKVLEHLTQVLKVYKKKFPLPYISIAENGQEGLHRFYVIGELFGWNTHKYPVLLITHADEEEAKRRALAKRENEISSNIKYAIQDTLRYYFRDLEEFKEQLQWCLDEKFQFDDEIEKPVKFTLKEDPNDSDYYIVKVDIGESELEKAKIHYMEPDEEDSEDEDLDIDIDDLDDDLEDFMSRYFGSNWKTTHKNTYDKLQSNINEDISNSIIQEMDALIRTEWAHDNPETGCIFIHPTGKFINIYPKLDDHEDLCYWLEEKGYETPEDAAYFVREFGYVRLRASTYESYVDLPPELTRYQIYSLQEWMEIKVKSDKLQIIYPNERWRSYNLDDYLPEEIINLIKRYYTSGNIY